MYDYIINDTYQNTCWILDQEYNIWHMLINRHTAFAVVSFGTNPSVLETVQKQNQANSIYWIIFINVINCLQWYFSIDTYCYSFDA